MMMRLYLQWNYIYDWIISIWMFRCVYSDCPGVLPWSIALFDDDHYTLTIMYTLNISRGLIMVFNDFIGFVLKCLDLGLVLGLLGHILRTVRRFLRLTFHDTSPVYRCSGRIFLLLCRSVCIVRKS